MGGVDVDADRDPAGPGVHRRAHRARATRRARTTRRRAAGRRAAGCPRPASARRSARRSSSRNSIPICSVRSPAGIEVCRWLRHSGDTTMRPWPQRRSDGKPDCAPAAAAARRSLAGLPRVLRAAGRELLDDDRPADQRGLRLHLDADQRPARRGADPRRGRLRRRPQDLPHRGLRRVQGDPQGDADRLPRPGRADPRGARRAERSRRCQAEGYEADDVIATLAVQGAGRGHGRAHRHR